MNKEFDAVLIKVEGIDGAYIEPPFDVEREFGAKRVKVKALMDETEYRGSIVRMGGIYMLGIPRAIRQAIGKDPGDAVHVIVEKDEQERSVQIPGELADALAKSTSAKSGFDSLSFTKRKQFADWVQGTIRAETRQARSEKAVQMLLEGKALK